MFCITSFNKLNNSIVVGVWILLIVISSFSFAQPQVTNNDTSPTPSLSEGIKTTTSTLLDPNILPINARIQALFSETSFNVDRAKNTIPQLLQISDNFNAAERYLMHVLQAKVLFADSQFQQAIAMLKQVETVEKSIVADQLNTPLFYQSHLDLAQNYVQLNDYEKAFLERKNYQEKYKEYLKLKKAAKIKKIEQKFNTDATHNQNELLAAENRIKAIQLADAERNRAAQHRNLIILICTSGLFLALIIRQYKIQKKLKKMARTDSLTGLMNRGSLFYLGQKLVEETLANQQTISAVLLDIDKFKRINDKYGHNVGDKVIKTIAALGAETMRSRDIFARLGGEEFVAILPQANIDEAKAIAQRLLDKITDFPKENFGINEPLSASFGVVNINQIEHNFDALIQAADEAMYRAKSAGRSQVSIYEGNG